MYIYIYIYSFGVFIHLICCFACLCNCAYLLHIILCCDACAFALSVFVLLNIVMFKSIDICHTGVI